MLNTYPFLCDKIQVLNIRREKMNRILKKVFSGILSVVMLLSAFPVISFAQETVTSDGLYVSHKNGDDTTGDGSQDNPYKTISVARANLGELSTIYIVDADYSVTARQSSIRLSFSVARLTRLFLLSRLTM